MARHVEEQNQDLEAQKKAQPQGLRSGESQKLAQGHEAAEVEPEFPDSLDAEQIHEQALEDHGQSPEQLRNPSGLESAMGRAANYWHYGQGTPGERMTDAAGALAHGMGMAQAFTDGNKRTAYHTTRYFLHNNGYGHVSPLDYDDDELAQHLEGHGLGTHSLEDTQALFRSRLRPEERTSHTSNILDPVHNELDPAVWDAPTEPQPRLRSEHHKWIVDTISSVLEDNGYEGSERWLTLVLTGSLTTYQYSDQSDCDVSLFVDTEQLPEWSRAEMIAIMVENFDGIMLPGTTHTMQGFVVSPKFSKEDLYKPGLRSGYDLDSDAWIVPPERDRVHDVAREMNESYTLALESSDKMSLLLKYEPDHAIDYWHQIHKRRMQDMQSGKGDYSSSNIIYKMLANRGLLDQISQVSGEYIG